MLAKYAVAVSKFWASSRGYMWNKKKFSAFVERCDYWLHQLRLVKIFQTCSIWRRSFSGYFLCFSFRHAWLHHTCIIYTVVGVPWSHAAIFIRRAFRRRLNVFISGVTTAYLLNWVVRNINYWPITTAQCRQNFFDLQRVLVVLMTGMNRTPAVCRNVSHVTYLSCAY